MVRQWVMVFGDAFLRPLVDTEVFDREVDELLVLFWNKNILVASLAP